jgi:hypothetical protein
LTIDKKNTTCMLIVLLVVVFWLLCRTVITKNDYLVYVWLFDDF